MVVRKIYFTYNNHYRGDLPYCMGRFTSFGPASLLLDISNNSGRA